MKSKWYDLWSFYDDDHFLIKLSDIDITGNFSSDAFRVLMALRFLACHDELDKYSAGALAKYLNSTRTIVTDAITELYEGGHLEPFIGTWVTAHKNGDVYFIQGISGGPIKIGKSVNVYSRLAALQTGHHEEFKILAIIKDGGFVLEKNLHNKFGKYNVRGEWFEPVPELLEYIEQNKSID